MIPPTLIMGLDAPGRPSPGFGPAVEVALTVLRGRGICHVSAAMPTDAESPAEADARAAEPAE